MWSLRNLRIACDFQTNNFLFLQSKTVIIFQSILRIPRTFSLFESWWWLTATYFKTRSTLFVGILSLPKIWTEKIRLCQETRTMRTSTMGDHSFEQLSHYINQSNNLMKIFRCRFGWREVIHEILHVVPHGHLHNTAKKRHLVILTYLTSLSSMFIYWGPSSRPLPKNWMLSTRNDSKNHKNGK